MTKRETAAGGGAFRVRATTILSVRTSKGVAIGGDGQVSIGETVVKEKANKIRRLAEGKVWCGFAGAAADAFSLMERFEEKLKDFQGNVPKAATELAKLWRTDRVLRRLESLLCVVDKDHSLIVSGSGDVIQPDDGIIGIGSGGQYAVAAARALVAHTKLSPVEIVKEALEVAAGICVYTNRHITVEEVT
ncbi:MAG TPA: ATP-dependent protease subunit HslV [Planctomycetota bacterium]|nr:ATP-dependent protease subunit HslV [Planctomycetota bacterium]